MLKTMPVDAFLDTLASDAPAPGGGSVSALNGAMAAGLLEMVCRLSLKRPELEDAYPLYRDAAPRLAELRTTLGRLLDEDAEAFSLVMAAFKLPKGTDKEKKARSEAIQAGYRHAIDIPLHTAAACVETARIGVEVSRAFNVNTASDLAVALECAQAGLRGGLLNADINLPSVKDAIYVQDVKRKMADLEKTMAGYRTRIEKHLKNIRNT